MRAIPAGLIAKGAVWGFTLISAALLVFAAYNLNPLAFALSPVALVVIMGYSYTKRFTSFSHLWLGDLPLNRADRRVDRHQRSI